MPNTFLGDIITSKIGANTFIHGCDSSQGHLSVREYIRALPVSTGDEAWGEEFLQTTGKGVSGVGYETLRFEDGRLILLDQRKLPGSVEYFTAETHGDVGRAIAEMVIRGAPAIGAAAAYGAYLAAREFAGAEKEEFFRRLEGALEGLSRTRPTAVNLFWALDRMRRRAEREGGLKPPELIAESLLEEAGGILRETVEINRRLAQYGNEIVPERAVILTHCNTGPLATVSIGTALGVIGEAHRSGKEVLVYANETRPRLQGARLTAFELIQQGIPTTLIADSVAATLIRDGEIDLVIVGADRIAASGDVANKIGTFMLSQVARAFDVPFYVAAPISSFDFGLQSGSEIEIEERSPEEVTHVDGVRIAPEGVGVYNPAFDVTPARNITGIITERGILRRPLSESISEIGAR